MATVVRAPGKIIVVGGRMIVVGIAMAVIIPRSVIKVVGTDGSVAVGAVADGVRSARVGEVAERRDEHEQAELRRKAEGKRRKGGSTCCWSQ